MIRKPSLWNAVLLVTVFAALAPAIGSAGICIEPDSSCNAYFFSVDLGQDGMRDLAGYEYGCASEVRSATGLLRNDNGNHYVGITGSNGALNDSGQIVQWNYVISQATLTGTYEATFTYINSGVAAGHGSTGTVTAFSCSDPGFAARVEGRDLALAP